MKNKLSLTIVFILTVFNLQAQIYTGIVKNIKGKAIPFANVVFYSFPDSTLVTGTITNDTGKFLLETKNKRKGFFKISFIGYKTKKVLAQENIGTIILEEMENALDEIVVKARLPKMQVKNDAFVTTIQNSVLAKAGTANNVLQRLPMLTGEDGVYTVFGKGEAKIYINNREMRDTSELENLNSDDIKSVEIVSNPGARYDASIKAVVRIFTKKTVGDGFSFDMRSAYYQGKNTDLFERLNTNYRNRKWDIFSTISYSNNNQLEDDIMRQISYADTIWKQESHSVFNFDNRSLLLLGGVNYEITPKQFAGVKYTYKHKLLGEENSDLDNNIYADKQLYDKWTTNGFTEDDKSPQHILNAYYNGTLGKLDLNFDLTYFTKKEKSSTETIEKSEYNADRTVNTHSDFDNQMFASKIVLTYPIWKGELSVGNEFANTKRNDAYWANQIVPSSTTRIEQKSNSFFAEYAKNTKVGQFSAGLRYENRNTDYFVNAIFNAEQSREYKQWFPSFSYANKIKGIGIQLSYSSKTNRPSYRQLSNNTWYVNRFTMQSGNPFLSPSVTHDITLAGSWKFLQLMLSYQHEKDAIIYWTEQMKNNPAVGIIQYKNTDKLPKFLAYLTVSPKIGIWSPQLSLGFQKQWLDIRTNNGVVHLNNILPTASFKNSFEFPKNFLFTADMNFQGKGSYQNIEMIENSFILKLGLTKTFFDDRLSVAIKAHDIFNDKGQGKLMYNDNIDLFVKNEFDSREIEFIIRYKFNSVKSKYKGKGAGKSEIKRM